MILCSLNWIDILHLEIYWKGLYFISWPFLSTKLRVLQRGEFFWAQSFGTKSMVPATALFFSNSLTAMKSRHTGGMREWISQTLSRTCSQWLKTSHQVLPSITDTLRTNQALHHHRFTGNKTMAVSKKLQQFQLPWLNICSSRTDV